MEMRIIAISIEILNWPFKGFQAVRLRHKQISLETLWDFTMPKGTFVETRKIHSKTFSRKQKHTKQSAFVWKRTKAKIFSRAHFFHLANISHLPLAYISVQRARWSVTFIIASGKCPRKNIFSNIWLSGGQKKDFDDKFALNTTSYKNFRKHYRLESKSNKRLNELCARKS